MTQPEHWQNPIVVPVGEVQTEIDPSRLKPSRGVLSRNRLEAQRQLILQDVERWTPILVCSQGVICDGHHAVRAAFEQGRLVKVLVTPQPVRSSGPTIQELVVE